MSTFYLVGFKHKPRTIREIRDLIYPYKSDSDVITFDDKSATVEEITRKLIDDVYKKGKSYSNKEMRAAIETHIFDLNQVQTYYNESQEFKNKWEAEHQLNIDSEPKAYQKFFDIQQIGHNQYIKERDVAIDKLWEDEIERFNDTSVYSFLFLSHTRLGYVMERADLFYDLPNIKFIN
jgi:hypothetical protein